MDNSISSEKIVSLLRKWMRGECGLMDVKKELREEYGVEIKETGRVVRLLRRTIELKTRWEGREWIDHFHDLTNSKIEDIRFSPYLEIVLNTEPDILEGKGKLVERDFLIGLFITPIKKKREEEKIP